MTCDLSATDRVFNVPELLEMIFSYFNDDRDADGDRHDSKSLPRLAQTCRLFNKCAVKLLWTELDSMAPLFRALPADRVSVVWKQDDWEWHVKCTSLPLEADWSRFQLYARYVRSVSRAPAGDVGSLLEAGSHFHVGGMLPNLCTLKWSVANRDGLQALLQLLGPNLTTLQVFVKKKAIPDLPYVNANISRKAPLVRDFGFIGPEDEDEPQSVFSQAGGRLYQLLTSYRHLRHLRLDQRTLAALIQEPLVLPDLTSLTFYGFLPWKFRRDHPITSAEVTSAFPVLRQMSGSIRPYFVPFWVVLLPLVGHSITDISFEDQMSHDMVLPSIGRLFQTIGDSCPRLSCLTACELEYYPNRDFSAFVPIIKPLLQCRELIKLEIVVESENDDISLNLTTDEVVQMGKAWPNLEVLKLGWSGEADWDENLGVDHIAKRPDLKLDSISELCARCPRLRSLTLAVDARTCPAESPNNNLGRFVSHLEVLDFSGSWIDDPFPVAAWLGDLCPAYAITSSRYELCEIGRHGIWKRVRAYVEGLQHVRRLERVLAMKEMQGA